MKTKLLLAGTSLCISSLAALSAEYSEPVHRLIHIDGVGLIAQKFCIYKNDLYSEGAEVQMASQRLYRCERLKEGKTTSDDQWRLKWVVIQDEN